MLQLRLPRLPETLIKTTAVQIFTLANEIIYSSFDSFVAIVL